MNQMMCFGKHSHCEFILLRVDCHDEIELYCTPQVSTFLLHNDTNPEDTHQYLEYSTHI